MNPFTANCTKAWCKQKGDNGDQWGHGQVRQGWDLLVAVEMYMELKHDIYIPLVRPPKSGVPYNCL